MGALVIGEALTLAAIFVGSVVGNALTRCLIACFTTGGIRKLLRKFEHGTAMCTVCHTTFYGKRYDE